MGHRGILVAGFLLCCAAGLPALAQESAPPPQADQPPSPPAQTQPQSPVRETHEKPSQLARPNGNSPVDPNQSGAPAASDAGAAARQPAAPIVPAGDWMAPLRRFAGTFSVKGQGGAPVTYQNICQDSGTRYLSCEQLQGGETVSLLILVPGDEPGHYFTQRVLPSGTATGRGDLTVDGNRWVFSSQTALASGALDYQRLTITFSAKDDGARFVSERSDDGEHWMTTNSGTEKREK